ncbi:transposase (plasmid) [Deinococcus taeanensis]|uniref:transposase n=1 Tax=Deinococcus taeanensis TaxID=2737050 RepID=UPI001CDD144C|nr:transposase [Deinococcus taeanensis]UBV45266.1 transposase [Deinococcus taeanensis]
MQIVVTRSMAGDLVCLATDLHAQDACLTYRLRWSVECTFSSMKSRGFDLERTGMTQDDRLERLFGIVTLAWVWCLRGGVDGALERPIPIKAHGRKALSLVTAGWECLAHTLRWDRPARVPFVNLFTTRFPAPGAVGG